MRSRVLATFLVACAVLRGVAPAQVALPPQVVGPLVGPGAAPAQPGLRLYGTDLGWTFEHEGRLLMLFGDTWSAARSLCDGEPRNDDTQAILPSTLPAGVPPLTFLTHAEAPDEFAPLLLTRGDESLSLAYGQVPLAGFSDGRNAIALFGRGEYVRCTRRSANAAPSCGEAHLRCTQDVGECSPQLLTIPALCDLASGAGCILDTRCQPSATGFCVDPTSSQSDGTPASVRFTVAHDQEFAAQDPAQPGAYRSIGRLATSKFVNATARAVRCFTGRTCGSDYGGGQGAVLVWGRPGFTAEQGRQAQLYLLALRLPLRASRGGRARIRPLYFAGVNPASGQPRWSRREARAAPLALDGVVGGSPREDEPIVSQMAVSWVGEPLNKWVMLYGGDLPDYVLADPARARPGPSPGAVRIRFADHPWGPWTPPQPHLLPGDPSVVGDPYGPGGVLFHGRCVDQGPAACAPGDPTRPTDFFFPGCPAIGAAVDVGRFYGANVIDAYTQPDGTDGVTLSWNVSTWNPYGVALVRSTIRPGTPRPACRRASRNPVVRWCAADR